jgi:hypothetical protein
MAASGIGMGIVHWRASPSLDWIFGYQSLKKIGSGTKRTKGHYCAMAGQS